MELPQGAIPQKQGWGWFSQLWIQTLWKEGLLCFWAVSFPVVNILSQSRFTTLSSSKGVTIFVPWIGFYFFCCIKLHPAKHSVILGTILFPFVTFLSSVSVMGLNRYFPEHSRRIYFYPSARTISIIVINIVVICQNFLAYLIFIFEKYKINCTWYLCSNIKWTLNKPKFCLFIHFLFPLYHFEWILNLSKIYSSLNHTNSTSRSV